MSKASTRRERPSARRAARRLTNPQNSKSLGLMDINLGSGSVMQPPPCEFFSKDRMLPVGLTLSFAAPLEGGFETGRQRLNRPTLLIHAQDRAFGCCWFSRPIDLGDESGNPAFWMLQKTAADKWFLCLRRVSGQLAEYHLKSRSEQFPIKLKKGRTTRDFRWPATVEISCGE